MNKFDLGSDIESVRKRLYSMAYAMLRSPADAEDVVQDTFLRWYYADSDAVRSATAWMTTAARRLCIDRIRLERRDRNRERLLCSSLTPLLHDSTGASADLIAAFTTLLECLDYVDRAALLLHDVFGYSYDEMALLFSKRNDACRQMVRRAKSRVVTRLEGRQKGGSVAPFRISRFVDAIREGNVEAALSSMALTDTDCRTASTLIRRACPKRSSRARFTTVA